MLRDKEQILANLTDGGEQIVDARARGRFEGNEPEPRDGLRSGRIPGSLNLPFTELLDTTTQTLRDKDSLRGCFEAAGVDMRKPVITTCGSGITAAVLALGLHLAGHRDVSLYDGYWAEWGLPGDTPVETGPRT